MLAMLDERAAEEDKAEARSRPGKRPHEETLRGRIAREEEERKTGAPCPRAHFFASQPQRAGYGFGHAQCCIY